MASLFCRRCGSTDRRCGKHTLALAATEIIIDLFLFQLFIDFFILLFNIRLLFFSPGSPILGKLKYSLNLSLKDVLFHSSQNNSSMQPTFPEILKTVLFY